MKKKTLTIRQLLSIVALLFWMGFIFYMSAQNGEESTKTSDRTIEVITEFTEKLFPSSPTQPLLIRGYIRTLGHFTEFFILGLIAASLLRSFRIMPLKSFVLSVAFCMLYALSDEIHQLFVDGRACELSDWLVDSAGSILGSLLFIIISHMLNMILKNFAKKN